jgi:methylmalonyl-CoA mutase
MEQISSSDPMECNQLALEALSGGTDGIMLDIGGISDLGNLFADISLPDCQLGITATPAELNNLENFLCSSNSEINGFLIIDKLLSRLDTEPNEILKLLNKFVNCRKLVLMETPVKAGSLSEIAQLLSLGVYILNTLLDKEVPLRLILQNIQFNLSVGDVYLWEICRIRCLRFLFNSIVTQYDTQFASKKIFIHATTSDPSPFDSSEQSNNGDIENLKLISNTTQAMAAILGGCDILTVDPGKPPAQDDIKHRRIARNVSHILKEESFLNLVADPVAGSYYLEELTSNMMKKVWRDFQAIEHAGGYLKLSGNET